MKKIGGMCRHTYSKGNLISLLDVTWTAQKTKKLGRRYTLTDRETAR
jgi:hypothetical protein